MLRPHPHPPAAAVGASSRPLGLLHSPSHAAHSPCSPHRLAAPAHQRQQVRHASRRQQQRHPQHLRAFADGGEGHPSDGRLDSGDELASEFAQHINQLSLKAPLQHRRPSPLDPPTAAVAAQMDAMQINDWPEPDAGVHTALAFAKPFQCEDLVSAAAVMDTGSAAPLRPQFGKRRSTTSTDTSSSGSTSTSSTSSSGTTGGGGAHDASTTSSSSSSSSSGNAANEPRVRSWSAREAWLTPQEFAAELHSATYAPLLGCDSWRAASNMAFTAGRGGQQRAVQAVEVLSSKQHGVAPAAAAVGASGASGSGSSGSGGISGLQRYTFTFILERIAVGPYKHCWLTVGVRPGNYAV